MILRTLGGRQKRRVRAPFLPALVSLGLAAASSQSCRAPTPDEHVYTGRSQASGPSAGSTGGTGAALPVATGGALSVGTGGVPGVSVGGEGGEGLSVAVGGGPTADAGTSGLGGAGGASDVEPPVTFSKQALLAAVADCTLEGLREFVGLAETLRDRAQQQVAARTPESVEQVRAAFREAMSAWQTLEVHRIGPAARKSEDPAAGQDLRDQVYAWPLGGRCNIETQVVSEGYAQPDFSTQLINVRGLGTLEYLLFNDEAGNGCPAYAPMNVQGTWAALGTEQLRARKAAYARVVADDVLKHAQALVSAWDAGKFRDQLAGAGGDGSPYSSQQAALNAVSNALFYVEREVKDQKLALPMGLSPACVSGLCPESLESQYAHLSTSYVLQNLAGFERLFSGCGPQASGVGFDDWLNEVGAADLSNRMKVALRDASRAVAELDPPFEQAILSEPAAALAVYASLKQLTDLLKTEFVSTLQLELPTGSETDND